MISHIELFKGKMNLADYVAYFEFVVTLLGISDVLKCKMFFTTFKESSLQWFPLSRPGLVSSCR
ncbi:hypothetical protein MA16_Dca022490 [Dendrobium catenatum]|uniref:Retrotransposon gag domain-containing protein n=1 Tax=Dendrobium catenatum TaxID=906689 RepID=A0A2I0XG12_9ASPA|nr:hypothetical protein MA16_Dca022490 [Dendrobium catenatum]